MSHYKKDGSLDMRYSSSKAAVASGNYSGSSSAASVTNYGGSSPSCPSASNMHYKKDGSLDMRYSSSKAAVASRNYLGSSSPASATNYDPSPSASNLHYKKDGTLDMRYNSSKQASTLSREHMGTDAGLHCKKDGTLDMRYNSSKLATQLASLQVSPSSPFRIPPSVPTKKDGTPDMRTNAAKSWVADQGRTNGKNVPPWVPHLKDGTINVFSPLGKAYKDAMPQETYSQSESDDQQRRIDYWQRQFLENAQFRDLFETQMEVDVPDPMSQESQQSSAYTPDLEEIDATELVTVKEIGRGGFGTVEEAKWRGKSVAIKRLHLSRMTRKDTENFRKELEIARRLLLFQHPNLVATLAYCVQPPILVMELVELGSLANVLHYNREPAVEAKICDGRVKRKLAFGIADGMRQLHEARICHRDLKPHNILVTDNWTAKVGDFGLAELRDLTSCSVASDQLQEDGPQNPAGTAAYMAPELLDSTKPCTFECDVYSYGVLLNELISEEQPYSGQMHRFGGRGPFGAANYAKLGNRPTMARDISKHVKDLIELCWHSEPASRPTFKAILRAVEDKRFVIPNGGGLRA